MRELKYPENHFRDNRKKVSEVLEELGYGIKREPDKVYFTYIEQKDNGIRERKKACVMDFRTIEVSDDGQYMVEVKIKGCHIGIAQCLPRREVEMFKNFDVLSDVKKRLLTGILLKLLAEQFDADGMIVYEKEERADMIYIRAGVKVTEPHRMPVVPIT